MRQQAEQHELFAEAQPPATCLHIPADQPMLMQPTEIIYQDDFITEAEEQDLLNAIDNAPWICDLERRVQHYGYRYSYNKRRVGADSKIGDLPDWSRPVTDRLVDAGFFEQQPDQLIVNEYMPGQGIARHIDSDCFGPVIAAVSLGSDCMLDIHPPPDRGATFEIAVLRRSLMVYRGVGRSEYAHGIRKRKNDTQNGEKIPRERRVSLTFRTVL